MAFVSIHDAPGGYQLPEGYSAPTKLGVEEIAVCIDVLGATVVYCRWRSREDYLRNATGLFDRLGPAASFPERRESQLFVRSVASARRPWTLLRAWHCLVALVAGYGVLLTLRNHYADLFSSPDVVVTVAPSPCRVLAGSDFHVDVTVLNRSVVPANKTMLRIIGDPGIAEQTDDIGSLVIASGASSEALAVGQTHRLRIQGRVLPKRFHAPTTRTVLVSIEANAGLLRGARDDPVSATVEIWPEVAHGALTVHANGARATVRTTLLVGRDYPGGLRCSASLDSAEDVRIVAVAMDGAHAMHMLESAPPDQPPRACILKWELERVAPFSRVPLSLTLLAQKERSNWDEFAKTIQVRALPRRNGEQ